MIFIFFFRKCLPFFPLPLQNKEIVVIFQTKSGRTKKYEKYEKKKQNEKLAEMV